jgi:hypothetical protein
MHDGEVGQSLHKLVKVMGGVETIAKGLETDLVVSNLTLNFERVYQLFECRKELRGHRPVSNVDVESNDYKHFLRI